MYLPNFPLMSDEELSVWVREKIANRDKESVVCDYKEKLELSKSGKRELLKDVTGFANEIGGVILVGVPEEKDPNGNNSGIPSSQYGIDPVPDLAIKIQNIVRNGVVPALPALYVREIRVGEEGKVVYFIFHPQSWSRPHAVINDGAARFYRRGSDATFPMQEHEIEGCYSERLMAKRNISDYLRSLDYGDGILENSEGFLKVAIVPVSYHEEVINIFSDEGRTFLRHHTLLIGGGGNFWVPNKDGAITFGGAISPAQSKYIAKIFPSGAFTLISKFVDVNDGVSVQTVAAHAYREDLARFLQKYFTDLHFIGDLVIKVGCRIPKGKLVASINFLSIAEPMPELFTDNYLDIEVITTSNEVISNPEAVRNNIADKVANLIGLWSSPKQR